MFCWACQWAEELVQNSQALELPLYLTEMMVRHHVIKRYSQSRTETASSITLKSACRSWIFHFLLVVKTHAASILRCEDAFGKLCGFSKEFSIHILQFEKITWANWEGEDAPFHSITVTNEIQNVTLHVWFWGCVHKAFRPIALCSKRPCWRPWWTTSHLASAKRQLDSFWLDPAFKFLPRGFYVCILCLFNKADDQKTVMLL